MTASHKLLLIRHCQASGQAPEAALTDTGQEQAAELARFLTDLPVDLIVSSSYMRARQTIAPFATLKGLTVQLDERLVERTLAPGPVANWRQLIRDSFDDLDFHVPGGESGREVQERGWAALDELWHGDHALPLAVTHGNLLSLILHSVDPDFRYEQWEALTNPDVYLLQENGDGRLQFERIWS